MINYYLMLRVNMDIHQRAIASVAAITRSAAFWIVASYESNALIK